MNEEAKSTWNDVPMCACPHCEGKFQMDDYCDIEIGDTLECPKCEQTIHITIVDHCIVAQFSTHADDWSIR